MKILNLDVETSPAKVYTWDLRVNGWLSPEKVIVPKSMICLAAKWVGDDDVFFFSDWKPGHGQMIHEIWCLLEEADAVLHYNGARFDIPVLNTEFALAALPPPSPYSQIDLYKTAKSKFGFMSNSLDYVTKTLGTARKLENSGFDLWMRVEAGERKARLEMEAYNRQDVLANEALYEYLLPWIPNHPSHAAMSGEDVCPQCGGESLVRQGFAYTAVSKFQRYQCQDCGKWSRATRRETGTEIRAL